MTETAGTDAGTAADPQTQAQPTAPAAPAAPAQPAPTPGVADRGAEDMLADALDGDGDSGDGGDDAASQLAKAQAEAKKWKDFARKHEAKVKELSPAAKRLAEIEDANKSEVQRATDRAAEAERRAAEAEGRYHRTLAAAQYGLPPDLIDLIGGTSEEEITASAEQIASVINTRVEEQVATRLSAITAANSNGNGTGQQAPARSQRPVESLRPGALPAGQGAAFDGNSFIRQALEARR